MALSYMALSYMGCPCCPERAVCTHATAQQGQTLKPCGLGRPAQRLGHQNRRMRAAACDQWHATSCTSLTAACSQPNTTSEWVHQPH